MKGQRTPLRSLAAALACGLLPVILPAQEDSLSMAQAIGTLDGAPPTLREPATRFPTTPISDDGDRYERLLPTGQFLVDPMNTFNGEMHVEVLDEHGRAVRNQRVSIHSRELVSLRTDDLPPGRYVLRVRTERSTQVHRFVRPWP
jgi:hypothetical protein